MLCKNRLKIYLMKKLLLQSHHSFEALFAKPKFVSKIKSTHLSEIRENDDEIFLVTQR